MFELVVCYVAGTAAGLLLFHSWVKERIITQTLDMLIHEQYVRSWIDEEGTIQLYKWHEGRDIDEEMWERLSELMEELQGVDDEERIENIMEKGNEEDDTP